MDRTLRVAAARHLCLKIVHGLTKQWRQLWRHAARARKAVQRVFRDAVEMFRIVKRGWLDRKESKAKEVKPPTASEDTVTLALPMLISGLLVAAVCIPWAIWLARRSGNDTLSVLLLLQMPNGLPDNFWKHLIPDFRVTGGPLLAVCLGSLYGVTGIVGGVVLLSGGLIRLVVIANGLFFGYLMTAFVYGLSGLGVNDPLGRGTVLKFAALLLAYYLAHGIPLLLTANPYAREKYTFLLAGLQALFAGWLLAGAFGGESVLFAGVIYLVCTFAMIFVFERTIIPAYETVVHIAARYDVILRDEEYTFSARALIESAVDDTGSVRPEIWICALVFILFPISIATVCWLWVVL